MKIPARLAALAACLTILFTTSCAVPFEDGIPPVSPNENPLAALPDQEEVVPMDAENKIWNVKDFGAVGTGRTDDYTALQRAVNTVLRKGGGTLYFPVGTYTISQTLRITMEGDAPLTLLSDPAGGATLQTDGNLEGNVLYVNHPYVTMENIGFSQNAKGYYPAVVLMSDYTTMNNCSVYVSEGNTAPMVQVFGSCNTLTATGWGYAATTPHIVEFSKREGIVAYGNVLEDSYFGGNHDKCVLVTSEEDDGAQENLIIRRNVFLLSAAGQVEVRAGKNISINDNMLDAGNINILLAPEKAGIDGIAVTNNYCGSSTGGLHVTNGNGGEVKDLVVSANYFWNPDCFKVDINNCSGLILTDNYFVKTNGTAIFVKNGNGAFLEGNIVVSLGGDLGLSIRSVDDDTVIQYNSFGEVKVPEWNNRFKALN